MTRRPAAGARYRAVPARRLVLPRTPLAALLLAWLTAGPAAAGPPAAVQVNMRHVFNGDLIVNHDGSVDTTQATLDGATALATQAAVTAGGCGSPAGLPDDGFFPATAHRPAVQLAYRNDDDGNNAWFLDSVTGSVTAEVPALRYQELHLYATNGDGDSNLTVTLAYTSGADVAVTPLSAPDWFYDSDPDGTNAAPGVYQLVDDMDRMNYLGTSCDDVNDATVWGITVPVDATRVLRSFTITRLDAPGGLAVLDAIALPAQAVTNVDLTSHFNADLVVNYTGGTMDPTQSGQDGEGNNSVLLTQSAAAQLSCGPGLPDAGSFPAGTGHPAVQLGYSNASNGDNARRVAAGGIDAFTVDVPDGNYDQIHIFATAGAGSREISTAASYGGPPVIQQVVVPDWFDPPTYAEGGVYALAGGMDRAETTTGSSCQDANGAQLFGAIVAADPAQTLQSVELATTIGGSGVLGIFGMSLMTNVPLIFADGFGSGDVSSWTSSQP